MGMDELPSMPTSDLSTSDGVDAMRAWVESAEQAVVTAKQRCVLARRATLGTRATQQIICPFPPV